VYGIEFSPDGRYLATASRAVSSLQPNLLESYTFSQSDESAIVWEARNGRKIARMPHDNGVNAVAFSPNGRYLATAGNDRSARVWEAKSGREVARMTHDDNVLDVAFSPAGKYLATASGETPDAVGDKRDNTARVWEVSGGREIARMKHEGGLNKIAFSPDGKYLATASDDHTARLWEAASGRELARMIHEDRVTSVGFRRGWTIFGYGE
jgi:WD40 repeat protein